MTHRRVEIAGSALIAVFLLSGCAFHGNRLPTVGSFQPLPEGTKKPSLAYSFSSGVADQRGKREAKESVRAQQEQEFLDVLRESGCFASLAPGDKGEIKIQARMVKSSSYPKILSFVAAFFACMIPSWQNESYEVTANVSRQNDKHYTYQLSDSMTTVVWLPMIFALPFKTPGDTAREVRRNIWKNLILKMRIDGILLQ